MDNTKLNIVLFLEEIKDAVFLIGLDTLDNYSLEVLSVYNQLECVREGWKVPVERKFGHIYWDWAKEFYTYFSRPQLERFHRHLLHPSTRKLYNLLTRAKPEQLTTETRKTLENIKRTCETCQLYAPKQFVFCIRDTESIRFNHKILIDVMYLERDISGRATRKQKQLPVLHIIDAGTKFQNASFLPKLDTTTIWNAFIKIWVSMYVGFPESMLTDRGSVFWSKEWKYNCEVAQIDLKHIGTESHNSLGAGETYHPILRRVYQKTRREHPTVPADVTLAMTVKAINSTVGPHGLCPQLLVFGTLPHIPGICPNEFPQQKERLRAMERAREEYEKSVSKALVQRGLRTIPPPSADHKYMPGDFVYVYREGVKHYTGPHLVATVNGKQARICLGENTGPREFNISQLRPAPLTRVKSIEEIRENHYLEGPRVFAHRGTGPDDKRRIEFAPQFDDAMRQEILGLIEKGTFRIVMEEELEPNPNIIPSRLVLSLKHSGTGETKFKPRFVLGGHRDKAKDSVVHNTVNLKQSSICILMALAKILVFDLWSLDVKKAYLQSASHLQRKVYIKPREILLAPGEFLQIVLPLYGLGDAGDYLCETFAKFHVHNLRMQQLTGDFAFFFRRYANQLVAMSGSHVDDVLQAYLNLKRKSNDNSRNISILLYPIPCSSYIQE